MTDMIKISGIGKGDKIRAYDFEPITGRPECYIEGKIIAEDPSHIDFNCYVVMIDKDFYRGLPVTGIKSRVGDVAYVPKMMYTDFELRVTKIG